MLYTGSTNADADIVGEGVIVRVGEQVPSHAGTDEYGATVTPRNTVFVGARESTNVKSLAVLYE